ncbi:hypothetical protein AGMMS49975_13960 [Clostridia bacterium]|nr:hypothetical protein AGMMS49975_13960 [Clostridia bacterium]
MSQKSKAIIAVVGIIILVFSVSGCGWRGLIQNKDDEEDIYDLTNKSSLSGIEAVKEWPSMSVSKEVLRCFSEDDFDSLKSMFCAKVAEKDGFDETLQGALDFFEGKVISYDGTLMRGGPASATDNWEVSWLDYHPQIHDIKTDAGKSYKIIFYYFRVYAKDEKQVGIYEIDIFGLDDESKYIVGEMLYKSP